MCQDFTCLQSRKDNNKTDIVSRLEWKVGGNKKLAESGRTQKTPNFLKTKNGQFISCSSIIYQSVLCITDHKGSKFSE